MEAHDGMVPGPPRTRGAPLAFSTLCQRLRVFVSPFSSAFGPGVPQARARWARFPSRRPPYPAIVILFDADITFAIDSLKLLTLLDLYLKRYFTPLAIERVERRLTLPKGAIHEKSHNWWNNIHNNDGASTDFVAGGFRGPRNRPGG